MTIGFKGKKGRYVEESIVFAGVGDDDEGPTEEEMYAQASAVYGFLVRNMDTEIFKVLEHKFMKGL